MPPSRPSVHREVIGALTEYPTAAACSTYLYGSVLWGEETSLRDGTPVSDIDLLVVGDSLDDLRIAAREIGALFLPFQRHEAPFFKLGLKLRMRSELAEAFLTANEASALEFGTLLAGKPIAFERPGPAWCGRQSDLVVPTRLQCNVTNRHLLACAADAETLRRYLAARTLLDLPTILLSATGYFGGSYDERLARFERELAAIPVTAGERRDLSLRLGAALRTKRDPEGNDCGSIDDAEALLVWFANRCGVTSEVLDGERFWISQRPLDVRDWRLRQAADHTDESAA